MDELIITLKDGCTLRVGHDEDSGRYGQYVRVCEPDGKEVQYWHHNEWQEDPILVMGALMCTAAGSRLQIVEGSRGSTS